MGPPGASLGGLSLPGVSRSAEARSRRVREVMVGQLPGRAPPCFMEAGDPAV